MNGTFTPAELERRLAAALASEAQTKVAVIPPNNELPSIEPAPLPEQIYPELDSVDVWIATQDGLRRWRPVIDRMTVTKLPNGARLLESGLGRLRLDAEQAAHLAQLLSDGSGQ